MFLFQKDCWQGWVFVLVLMYGLILASSILIAGYIVTWHLSLEIG